MSKQEAIEEAAERLYPNGCDGTDRSAEIYRRIFIDGAKLQAKIMYSEEDMKEAIRLGGENVYYYESCNCYRDSTIDMLFEEFKKTKNNLHI
jgi:hypothetical protein